MFLFFLNLDFAFIIIFWHKVAAVGKSTYIGAYGEVGEHKVFHQAWDSRKLGPERVLEVYAMEQTTFSSS